ncbi:MAG: RNA polymerase sigma factor RpoD, partial [Lysobacter sp.]|nr:RNA polymerase sigma factor RpoD [Lysobacter sp.]
MANERQTPQSDIKLLISKGLEQGFLTYAEVNDHLPDDMVDPEQIEDIIGMINGMGIEVHEVAPDAETLLLAGTSASGREVDDTAAEEAAAALSALDTETGRTTDPVRMYMREMGTVELLTREGEIAIAKRIEEGLNQMLYSLASFPWTINLLLADYDLHKAGKKRLAEIVAGFNDIEEPVAEIPVAVVAAEVDAEVEDVVDAVEAEAEEVGPVGPDPLEVARRMEAMSDLYAKFHRAYAKHGSSHKSVTKLRLEMADVFMTIKLPLPLVDTLVRKLREVLGQIKDHERKILELSTKKAGMPRKDFIRAWDGNQTNLG